jgi:adenylate cyclase
VLERDRKIATILAADVVGYSVHMQRDESGTLARLKERRQVFDQVIAAHGGRVFGSVGDSLMAEFPSAVNAVHGAREVQAQIASLNAALPAQQRMELRIALNLGDVIDRDGALFGDGVNLASRLQAHAPPGGVVMSAAVQEQVKGKVGGPLAFEGRHRVKGFDEPVSIFRLDGTDGAPARMLANRAMAAAVAGFAIVAAVAGTWWWARSPEQRPTTPVPSATSQLPVIAVAPVQNLTGEMKYDWLGLGLSNLVRDRLAQSKYFTTVSRGRWDTIVAGTNEPGEIHRRARAAKIDYVLAGELLASPNGLILTHRVSNLRDGTDVVSQAFEGLDASEVIGAAYRLTILAKQALRVPQTEQVDSYAADFAVQHLGAYEAYVSGLRYHLEFDFARAEQSMRAALALAPDFHMARYRLAMIRNATGYTREASKIMQQIPQSALLGRRERLFIDAATAFFVQDFPRAIATYQRLLQEFPNEVEGRQRLAEAYFHARQDEDAVRELRFLGQLEPENEEVWNQLTAYLTIFGDLDGATAANRVHTKLAPGKPHPLSLRADIQRERGDLSGALAGYEQALALDCHFAPAVLGQADIHAIQGRIADAVELYRAILPDDRLEPEARLTAALNLAALLRARGQFAESSAVLTKMAPLYEEESIRLAQTLSLRAANALSAGDARGARRLAEEAVEKSPAGGVPTRYLHMRGLLEIARGDLSAVAKTAAEIRMHALPPEDPDRTEEKAALHLEALTELAAGQARSAAERLKRAVDLGGYRYQVYEIDLARALMQSGRSAEADALLAMSVEARDAGDPRIDLEPERVRAHRLRMELASKAANVTLVARLRNELEKRWSPRTGAQVRRAACAVKAQRGTRTFELELPVMQAVPDESLPSRSLYISEGTGQAVSELSSSRAGPAVRITMLASFDSRVLPASSTSAAVYSPSAFRSLITLGARPLTSTARTLTCLIGMRSAMAFGIQPIPAEGGRGTGKWWPVTGPPSTRCR